VRFAETYNQRVQEEEDAKKAEEGEGDKEEEEKGEVKDRKPKKVRVNEEYVKEKVKQQLKNLASKNRNKPNKNKDRKAIKNKNEIRDVVESM